MQAGSTARRRMGGETGERGGAGQRDQGNTKKSRGHTQGAREQQGARAQKKKTTAGRADTQEGHIEVAGRGRWGEQGTNEGAREHNVTHREAGRPARPSGN